MRIMNNLPENIEKNSSNVSKNILVHAPPELCFSHIKKQLDSPDDWDRLVLHAWPVSADRSQKGAVSQVLFNLAGNVILSRAIIHRYQPDCCLSWFLAVSPRTWVTWHLSRVSQINTTVKITIGREKASPWIDKFWWRLWFQNKLKRDLNQTLIQFKHTIEKTYKM